MSSPGEQKVIHKNKSLWITYCAAVLGCSLSAAKLARDFPGHQDFSPENSAPWRGVAVEEVRPLENSRPPRARALRDGGGVVALWITPCFP